LFNRKILLLTMFFICLVAISPICAKDNATNVVGDEDRLNVDYQSNELITDEKATFNNLSDLIDNTPEESILYLDKNYSYDGADYSNGIYINKTITIDGMGHTLDGNNKSSIFVVNASNVIFKNIYFVNAYSSLSGGAIYFAKNGEIINSTFKFNFAHDNGGAIVSEGDLTIKNSTFIQNNAEEHGGAIFAKSNLTVLDSHFASNCAEEGGAIFADLLTIKNSFFEKNGASNNGGAIFISNKSSITNSTFKSNSATRAGAIMTLSNLVLLNNSFFYNIADYGGVILSGSFTIIKNSKFESNEAESTGGIFYGHSASIINSTFNKNLASYAGCIYLEYSSEILNSSFTNNFAYSGGAIILKNVLTLKNTEFLNNSAIDKSNNIALRSNASVDVENVTSDSQLALYFISLKFAYIVGNVYGETVSIVSVVSYDDLPVNVGSLSLVINNKTYSANISGGSAEIKIPNLDVGNYVVDVVYHYENCTESKYRLDFNVNPQYVVIGAKSTNLIVNYGGTYSVILKDYLGNALSSKQIIFTLNGKIIGVSKTNSKGSATFKLTSKILKTIGVGKKYLEIIFAGDKHYEAASKTVKINVIKEKTKFTAGKKTFKKSTKVKKYSVKLKNSKGKIIKGARITLKVNGRTYKATTNSKGMATFKINKLNKKGKFNSLLKYNGNKYYNAVSKKVKITVK